MLIVSDEFKSTDLGIIELLKILFNSNNYHIDYRLDGKVHGIHTPKYRAKVLRYLGISSCFLDNSCIYKKCEICCVNKKNNHQVHRCLTIKELAMHIIREHRNEVPLQVLLSALKNVEILSIQLQVGNLLE